MTEDTQFLVWLVGALISIAIIYFLIYYASGTGQRKKQLKIQNRILLHIAQKQGVEKDTLDILNKLNDEI